jgi:hypothetical protein
VDAQGVWDDGVNGRGVAVALIDTGVSENIGLTGASSTVRTCRSIPPSGSRRTPTARWTCHRWLAAIDGVVEHRNDAGMNIRVLNLSLGTDGVQDYHVDPLAYAAELAWWRKGIVVVAPYSQLGDANRSVDLLAPAWSVISTRASGSLADLTYSSARLGDRFLRGSRTSQTAAVVSEAEATHLPALATCSLPSWSAGRRRRCQPRSAMFVENARVRAGPHHVHDQGHECHGNETSDVLQVTVHDAQLPARVP